MCVGSIELLSRLQWASIPPRCSLGEVNAWEVREWLRAGSGGGSHAGDAGVGAACAGLESQHQINSLFLWFALEGELGEVLLFICLF